MPKIIFHYPGPIYDTQDSGEKKRPRKIAEAFTDEGFEVYPITGNLQDRRKRMASVRSRLTEYDFIYSENSTMPLALTNRLKLPAIASPDYALFESAYRQGVPAGVFYRDAYWQFPAFRQDAGVLKSRLALPLYDDEMRLYNRTARRIYVPSEPFRRMVTGLDPKKTMALFPGADILPSRRPAKHNPLRLIYAGSVKPPIYDLSPLFRDVTALKDHVHIDIFTRGDVWRQWFGRYHVPSCVSIHVDAAPQQIQKTYQKAHAALVYFADTDYRKIAMPLKLFEAIGCGLPIISRGDTAVSDFVKKENIGWIAGPDNIFDRLSHRPDLISAKRKTVLAIRRKHTWRERVRQIAKDLTR